MSIRAYRVITHKVADRPSFNLCHDDELIDFLKEVQLPNGDEPYTERLSEDGNGTIEVSVRALTKALKDFPFGKDGEDYREQSIKEDVEFAKKNKDSYVLYEAY